MASRVMLTGQVKRARGGTTWMLTEDTMDDAVRALHDSQNENLCPNLRQAPVHLGNSLSKLHIRASNAPDQRDDHGTRNEEEARLRRIGEQYCLPTKELLAAGSQEEESLRAILKRQKELLLEFQSHPIGALHPPSLPGTLQQPFLTSAETGQQLELFSAATCVDVSKKVDAIEISPPLGSISAKVFSSPRYPERCDTQKYWMREQYAPTQQQASVPANDHSQNFMDMSVLPDNPPAAMEAITTSEGFTLNQQEPVAQTTAGARAPLLPSRKTENQSRQPLSSSRTGCRPIAKASTPPSTLKQHIVSTKNEGFSNAKANDHGSKCMSRPWVTSYKRAATGSSLARTTKPGARKSRLLSSATIEPGGVELKDKLVAGEATQSGIVKLAPSDTNSIDTTQEKHMMVFASQSKEWEEEMTTMAAEPCAEQHAWKNKSCSSSRSATSSETAPGIGRYHMKDLTGLHERFNLQPKGDRSVVMTDMMSSRKDVLTRNSRKSRRLSQVLRSEDDLFRQNKHYAVELQHLQEQLDAQDYEVESLRTAGSLLKNLYSKQSEELKALKASYPVTFKETAELRELCRKQGEELKLSRAALPAFKSKVSTMASQIVSLRQDLAKVTTDRALTLKKLHQTEQAVQNRCSFCLHQCHRVDELTTRQDATRLPPRTHHFLKTQLEGNKRSPVHGVVPYEEQEHKRITDRDRSTQTTKVDRAKQGFRRIGDKFLSDKELGDMLSKLHSYANREQAILQERCANTLRGLRYPPDDEKQ